MTVNFEFPRIAYTGNGSSFSFSFLWSSSSDSEIKVTLDDEPLTEGIEYELEDYTEEFGGNVVFSAVPTIGSIVVIRRKTPITQQVDYVEDQPFPADTHEFQMDKDTRILQELFVDIGLVIGVVVDIASVPSATQVEITNTAGSNAFIQPWTPDGLLAGVSLGEVVDPGGPIPADGSPSTKPEGYIYWELEPNP